MVEISKGHVAEKRVTTMRNGRVSAVLIEETVHILGRSSSSFGMTIPTGSRHQYICQDGCCDRGLRPDVLALVEQAKALGATKVVIRTGQNGYYHSQIAGLPVEDVSDHVGSPVDGIIIDRRR